MYPIKILSFTHAEHTVKVSDMTGENKVRRIQDFKDITGCTWEEAEDFIVSCILMKHSFRYVK